ncbi:MAG: hypothetical protein QM305_09750 [Bacteroidota bacterium]|nr:hypothetical protein [Bacteroidota bacterium]
MNIYKDDFDISRSTNVNIEDGKFTITQYDIKPKVFDEERIFETDELDKVLIVFNASSTDELLQILKENYNTSDAFDRIIGLLINKVEGRYNRFTS